MLHAHIYLHIAPTVRTNVQSLGTFQKAILFQKSVGGGDETEQYFHLVFKGLDKLQTEGTSNSPQLTSHFLASSYN